MKYINFMGHPGSVESDIQRFLYENSIEIIAQSHAMVRDEDGGTKIVVGIFYKIK